MAELGVHPRLVIEINIIREIVDFGGVLKHGFDDFDT